MRREEGITMLTLTSNARNAIEALTGPQGGAPPGAGVRIAVAQDAPAMPNGAQASLTLTVARAPEPDDKVLDDGNARVFLDTGAAQMLHNQTLDAQVDPAQGVSFFLDPAGS